QDALAAYDAAMARFGADRLVGYGESLGTGVILKLAASKALRAVILEAPYMSTVAVAQQIYPYVPVALLMLGLEYAIVGVGEACRVVSIAPPRFAFCENSDCVRDKCVPRIPDGEICVSTELGGIACQQPAHCREGKCVLRDPSKCQ
ncbi:MAG: hypothetical protein J0I07_17215, partial [Myxococcales bacterium]|nr:hypothetical protein [Myxococcales bacterium]